MFLHIIHLSSHVIKKNIINLLPQPTLVEEVIFSPSFVYLTFPNVSQNVVNIF